MRIRRLGDVHCTVGEGPLWDVAEQALYFIDLLGKKLWRYDPANRTFVHWDMPEVIGSHALRESGGSLVALETGIYHFDHVTGRLEFLVAPSDLTDRVGFNDGKVDPCGRFVVGTQARARADIGPIGAIYSLDQNNNITRIGGPVSVPNGPCWSPDGRIFYFADSVLHSVFAYDYDLDHGTISNRRLFADTGKFGGFPDGATVDAAGRYWVTIMHAGKIICYRPNGDIEQVIDTPVSTPTSLMFGGAGLGELYFTTIDPTLVGQEAEPGGGGLFVIEGLGATGLPEKRFAG